MRINFFIDSDLGDYEAGRAEYAHLWREDGERIVVALERASGLVFREHTVNAIVFEGRSQSHPLGLRHNIPTEYKRSELVHELGHRLLLGRGREMETSEKRHRFLFLVLFGVLADLYGEQFARETVFRDSGFDSMYKDVWDWARAFTVDERRDEFTKLKSENVDIHNRHKTVP